MGNEELKMLMESEQDIFLFMGLFIGTSLAAFELMTISLQSAVIGVVIAVFSFKGKKYKEIFLHGVCALYLGNIFSQLGTMTTLGQIIDYKVTISLAVLFAMTMSCVFVVSVAWYFGKMTRHILTKVSRS